METHRCPHCDTDLKGQYIEESYIRDGKYAELCNRCGDKNHWRLETAWHDAKTGEMIGYICPVCRKGWGFDGYTQINNGVSIADYD